MQIPNELLDMVKTKINILREAIEKDENPDEQIAYRTFVSKYDSTLEGSFQVIIELIVDQRYFLEDGDIEIITDPIHKPEPYKVMPAQNILNEKDMIIAGLEEGSDNWKAEYDNCLEILKELVNLKNLKDEFGKSKDYLKRQPEVWATAREFISKYQHQS